MIFVQNNFLDKSSCQQIIDFYNENENSSCLMKYRDTFPFCVYHEPYGNELIIYNELISKTLDRIVSECNELSEPKNVKLSMCQIVKWPCGSKQSPHRDPPPDVFASILYLNDDYEGGRTCFEDCVINPEVGKILIFSNSELLHWVEEVKNSNRYTLALWFIGENDN